jgi:hypothetical protein
MDAERMIGGTGHTEGGTYENKYGWPAQSAIGYPKEGFSA